MRIKIEKMIYIVWGKNRNNEKWLSRVFTSKKAAEKYIKYMEKERGREYEIQEQNDLTKFWEND